MIEEAFVLVIGGGPVGLTLALDLGQRGVSTILVNEYADTARHPKCNMLNTRSMEHFRRLGIADELRAVGHAKEFPRAVAYRTRFCGYEIGRIELSFLSLKDWYGPEYPLHISQIDIEPVLKRNAEQQPKVRLKFGWQAIEITQDTDTATATIENVETGERKQVRAQYVVGCDGARSKVRDLIGARLQGEDGTAIRSFVSGTMMSYYFRSQALQDRSGHKPALMTWIINHDARGYIMAQRGGDRFVAHYPVPAGVDWQALTSDDVLGRMLGADVDVEILSQGPWTGGLAQVADTYGAGRIFIAGDAAHLFTPLGGFGLNTGAGDAINLSWKLAAVHDGWAGEGLLASYSAERQPIGVRNTRLGIACTTRKDEWRIPADINEDTAEAAEARKALGAFVEVDDLQEYATIGVQLGEHYASPIISEDQAAPPRDDPWDRYVPSDRPGGRAPHFKLPGGVSAYDALGQGYCLLAFMGAEGSRLQHAAAKRGVPFKLLKVADRPADYRHNLVLVRPDNHIAWSGNDLPDDCVALIDQVRGA